jgi:hypothetical protein
MNTYQFDHSLPNPEDPYSPYVDPFQANAHLMFAPSTVPRERALTYPGLFPSAYGGAFYPHLACDYLSIADTIRLQALFGARQFLTARCLEQRLPGVSEGNPLLRNGEGGLAALYSELSVLSATLGTVAFETIKGFGGTGPAAQRAYVDFTADMRAYAPWLRFPNGAADIHELVKDGQAKLVHVHELTEAHRVAHARFEEGQAAMVMTGPALKRDRRSLPV